MPASSPGNSSGAKAALRRAARGARDQFVVPAFQRSGLLQLTRQWRNRRTLTVAMFHRVLPLDSDDYRHSDREYAIGTDEFARCLTFFDRHYTVVSLADLERAAAGGGELPAHALLITFDDGWRDNVVHAAPILKRHRMKATLFVNVDAVRAPGLRWWQDALVELLREQPASVAASGLQPDLYRATGELLQRPLEARASVLEPHLPWSPTERQMLTVEEVASLDPAVWEVGSHGITHAPLSEVPDPGEELEESARLLSSWRKAPVGSISLPHGRHTPEVAARATHAYSLVFSSEPVLVDLRLGMSGLLGRLHISSAVCASEQSLARHLWIRRTGKSDAAPPSGGMPASGVVRPAPMTSAASKPPRPSAPAAGRPAGRVSGSRARFSVVIPLYNKAPYISAALQSALADPDHVGEVIVVDDGSTDGSADIVRSIADARIRLIGQANGGVSRARNRGLDAARFEWVAFLDADDFWLPGYLARLAALADRHPQCSMLATRYVLAGEDGVQRLPEGHWDLPARGSVVVEDYFGLMANGHACCTISTAVRRSMIEQLALRFPEGESMGEDLDFFFRAAEASPVALDVEPLAVYRESNDVVRLSRGHSRKLIAPFVERIESRCAGRMMPTDKREGCERYVATKYELAVMQAIEERRVRAARSLLLHPLLLARWRRWIGLLALSMLPTAIGTRILRLRRRLGRLRVHGA